MKRGPTPGARTIMIGASVSEAMKAMRCDTPRNMGFREAAVTSMASAPYGLTGGRSGTPRSGEGWHQAESGPPWWARPEGACLIATTS